MKVFNYLLIIYIVLAYSAITLTYGQIILPDENGKDVKLYNKSYALIIGVINYNNGWPKLRGVQKDIDAVKTEFEKQGFNVITVLDPDYKQLDLAYRDFINKYGMDPENRLIFYFAGHGHTIKSAYGEEMGYIVPVDAPNPNSDKNAFLTKAMAMQQIEVYAKEIQSKHAMFLFDACFSGSIFAITRAIPENISYKTGKPVRQFISSGSADETVPDESIFRQQLISGLEGEADLNQDGFITGTELGEFLTEKVINYSKNNQHPQYGKIRNPHLDKGDFVFLSGNAKANIETGNEETTSISRGASSNNVVKKVIKETPITKPKLPWQDEFQDMTSVFAKVAIRTAKGKFLSADNGGGGNMFADRDNIGSWETFYVMPLGDRKIALRTSKGEYLCIDENNESLRAVKDSAGLKETFDVIELEGNKVAFKSWDGKFVCAERGGGEHLSVNRDKIGEWEVFDFIKLRNIAIKSYNGQYVNSENNDNIKANYTNEKNLSQTAIEFIKASKTKVVLKTKKGTYLSLSGENIIQTNKNPDLNEMFDLEELGNNHVAFKANNGKYITAIGGGGFGLKADSDSISDWQKFELVTVQPK